MRLLRYRQARVHLLALNEPSSIARIPPLHQRGIFCIGWDRLKRVERGCGVCLDYWGLRGRRVNSWSLPAETALMLWPWSPGVLKRTFNLPTFWSVLEGW